MAFNKTAHYGDSLGILESEVGLVRRTATAKQSAAEADGDRKVIKAGSLFDDTAEGGSGILGVVFQDYDMTDYPQGYPISVVVQGRLKADRVAAEVTAKKEDLAAQGLHLISY